jgi:hypothetical protein
VLITPQVFGIAFLLGTGLIALWVDARFPRFAPGDLRRALIRTGIALVGTQIVFMPVFNAVIARGSIMVAVFAVAFPCMTYVLLSAIWSIRQLQASLQGPR